MKHIFTALISIFLFSSLAEAQSQGQGLALGGSGQPAFCRTNEALAAIATADGQANYAACNDYGQLLTVSSDASTGLSEAVLPLANNVGMNGGLVAGVVYDAVTTDTIEAASTTTVLNLTGHVARIGDVIKYRAGTAANIGTMTPVCAVATNSVTLCKPLPATPGLDNIGIMRPGLPAAGGADSSSVGYSLQVSVDSDYQNTNTTGLLKLEDVAHNSGDAGVQIFGVTNEAGSALVGSGAGRYGPIATNTKGAQYVQLSATVGTGNADNAVKAEDSAHNTADALVGIATVRNGGLTTLAGSNLDYAPLGSGTYGNAFTTEVFDLNVSAATQVPKLEDSAHNSSDALVGVAAVRNEALNTLTNLDGDYTPLGAGAKGNVFTSLYYDSAIGGAGGPVRPEDAVFSDTHILMMAGGVNNRTLASFNATQGDATPVGVTDTGAVLTTPAPPTTWFYCNSGADITNTSVTAVCAADADEIYNVTAISCSNTDATVGTRVDILDGATVIWQGVVGAGAATTNNIQQVFNPPLKAGAVNTAINAQAATTSAQVRCSISGYKTPS